MLEAVKGTETFCSGGFAFGCKVVELWGVAEHEVGRGVGIHRTIFADGVEAGGIGAEGEGCDAV